jgi:hypothetical protein
MAIVALRNVQPNKRHNLLSGQVDILVLINRTRFISIGNVIGYPVV